MLYGKLPEWAKDQIRNTTSIQFGFWDRVRILFGYHVTLYMKIETEHLPGHMETETEVSVWRESRKIQRQSKFGFAEARDGK